ncbi:unnamed protein product [Adineta steineri]|uniref:NHL repeat containing protein-like protein n=1 Tax=Adineta steineri TaxID=433720 RepID=A0A819H7S2_9BILA|nr:unnamed protein product [Adineta steineri]CAF3897500.1 unnamed protein product [Adineta steineri]
MLKAATVAGISDEQNNDDKRLSFCTGLALDSSNGIYVSDYQNNRIQKWAMYARRSKTVAGQMNGTTGSTMATLNFPTKVTVDLNGNIYVTDSENHRVQLWSDGDVAGTTVAGTGVAGTLSNELNTPWGIATDSKSNTFYVSDSYNNRIMRYQSGLMNGTVVAGGNGPGKGTTQLFLPRGLYFDSTSNSLIITNFACNNIVRWILGSDHWTLLAGSINGEFGATSTLLYYPSDVFLDRLGNLYVADTYNHRIQFFISGQTNGTTVAGVTSKPGVDPNLLDYPHSIVVDNQFSLYVADSGNYRIQKFLRS